LFSYASPNCVYSKASRGTFDRLHVLNYLEGRRKIYASGIRLESIWNIFEICLKDKFWILL
jgi:hypothetical protein